MKIHQFVKKGGLDSRTHKNNNTKSHFYRVRK